MSNKLKRFLVYARRASFFIPISIVAGFVGMSLFNSLNDNSLLRWRPNVPERTLASFQKKYTYKPNPIEKHLALVNVSLESPENIPETSDAPLLLKGHVVLTQGSANGGAKFKWLLPEGILVIRGAVEGQLDPSLVGIPQDVEIEISGFDQSEKKIITLEGQAIQDNQTFGSTALLSSRPQDSMEYIAPMMKESVDQLAVDREL